MSFVKTEVEELNFNPFTAIGKEWFLLSAGNEEKWNTMTASWGQMGIMWGSPAFTCMVRTNRYTYEFMENDDTFSICFFGGEYTQALSFCGSKSGRDYDKAKETGLTPVFIDGVPAFEEAKLVLVCKKQYADMLSEEKFTDKDCLKWYAENPYHKLYVGKIVSAYKKA